MSPTPESGAVAVVERAQSPESSAPARPNKKKNAAHVHPTASSTKTPEQIAAAQKEYGRGARASGSIKDKKLRGSMKKLDLRYREAATQAKDAEILRPESGPGFIEAEGELERTWKVGQKEIIEAVDVATASKGFGLDLAFGPYVADYSKDGRDLVIGGRKGHVATFDWREGKLGCELQLGETIRDVK